MKCQHCNQEIIIGQWLKIPELDIEVEIDVHDKGKSWDELGLSEREDELLTAQQCIWLANSKYAKVLKMDCSSSKDDFFIKQPFKKNREKGLVAGFYADSDSAYLVCRYVASGSYSYVGVRKCRDLKGRGEAKKKKSSKR